MKRFFPAVVSPWLLVPPLAVAALHNILLKAEAARGPLWKLTTEEVSSVAVILGLAPLVIMLAQRWPLTWRLTPALLARHLAGSLIFSLLHVIGMTAIRHLVFAAAGMEYRPGPPLDVLAYEYTKDIVVYALIVAAFSWLDCRFPQPAATPPTAPAPTFEVKTARGIVIVAADDILRVEAAGNYATLVTPAGAFLHRATMREIEAVLPPGRFARAHRSHIVRLDAITAIRGGDGDRTIRLGNGDAVPLSRRFAQARDWHCALHCGSAKATT
jgi:hypothetical protein